VCGETSLPAVTSRDEREALTRFRDRYAIPTAAVSRQIEQRVIGAAWGANGYTTLVQAIELGRRLNLDADRKLLDVGTGRGWPGLYLATQSGCHLVGTDLPLEPLVAAARRSRTEGVHERVALVAATGAHQPFRRASFDAVVHTDVLC
jgi:2-polyprenyl-3-methyl-5-hydroxy-6-metoxy-1,4-benzoquinol methylase